MPLDGAERARKSFGGWVGGWVGTKGQSPESFLMSFNMRPDSAHFTSVLVDPLPHHLPRKYISKGHGRVTKWSGMIFSKTVHRTLGVLNQMV